MTKVDELFSNVFCILFSAAADLGHRVGHLLLANGKAVRRCFFGSIQLMLLIALFRALGTGDQEYYK